MGIVARIQRHRRFPVLFEAVSRVMAELPNVWLLVLGRGTHAKEIAHDSVRRLGIGDRTRLPGYVGGDDYPAAVATFDLKVFLVPGSDGTCRAVREAMASGVPIVQPRRGAATEIVETTGGGLLVAPGDRDALARGLAEMLSDPARRRSLGDRGYDGVRAHYHAAAMRDRAIEVYRAALARAGRNG